MTTATAAQLIRMARLRRFVGVFARGGDREATSEALAELSRAARDGGLAGDALRRARQAAELLASEDAGEPGVRSLLQLGAACLDTGDAEAAAAAASVAQDRAATLDKPLRAPLIGCAALLAGIAHALRGDEPAARSCLAEARERLVAAHQPEGAALALTQQALLDTAAGRLDGAEICFRFARDFHRMSDPAAAAELAAIAARALAEAGAPAADRWYREAIADADRAGAGLLGAELAVELAATLERAGVREAAAAAATDAAGRCARVAEPAGRELALQARQQLMRLTDDPQDALRHVEAAFELALELGDPAALGAAMEALVTGLVDGRFTEAGWRLVARFRERLSRAGYDALAETAVTALADLRP